MAASQWALNEAVSITKEYARGGGAVNPNVVLENVYSKLCELEELVDGVKPGMATVVMPDYNYN